MVCRFVENECSVDPNGDSRGAGGRRNNIFSGRSIDVELLAIYLFAMNAAREKDKSETEENIWPKRSNVFFHY
jgi:hypothetical protein